MIQKKKDLFSLQKMSSSALYRPFYRFAAYYQLRLGKQSSCLSMFFCNNMGTCLKMTIKRTP